MALREAMSNPNAATLVLPEPALAITRVSLHKGKRRIQIPGMREKVYREEKVRAE
jgi:hypothetical protein